MADDSGLLAENKQSYMVSNDLRRALKNLKTPERQVDYLQRLGMEAFQDPNDPSSVVLRPRGVNEPFQKIERRGGWPEWQDLTDVEGSIANIVTGIPTVAAGFVGGSIPGAAAAGVANELAHEGFRSAQESIFDPAGASVKGAAKDLNQAVETGAISGAAGGALGVAGKLIGPHIRKAAIARLMGRAPKVAPKIEGTAKLPESFRKFEGKVLRPATAESRAAAADKEDFLKTIEKAKAGLNVKKEIPPTKLKLVSGNEPTSPKPVFEEGMEPRNELERNLQTLFGKGENLGRVEQLPEMAPGTASLYKQLTTLDTPGIPGVPLRTPEEARKIVYNLVTKQGQFGAGPGFEAEAQPWKSVAKAAKRGKQVRQGVGKYQHTYNGVEESPAEVIGNVQNAENLGVKVISKQVPQPKVIQKISPKKKLEDAKAILGKNKQWLEDIGLKPKTIDEAAPYKPGTLPPKAGPQPPRAGYPGKSERLRMEEAAAAKEREELRKTEEFLNAGPITGKKPTPPPAASRVNARVPREFTNPTPEELKRMLRAREELKRMGGAANKKVIAQAALLGLSGLTAAGAHGRLVRERNAGAREDARRKADEESWAKARKDMWHTTHPSEPPYIPQGPQLPPPTADELFSNMDENAYWAAVERAAARKNKLKGK